jgi:hypothetical protein
MGNSKIKRKWIKEEKRIVSLLYKKGFLKDFKVEDLYWAEYHWHNRKLYKSRSNKCDEDGEIYRYPIYMPEIHYCTTDYWGESDEHSIVSHVKERLYWEHVDNTNWDPEYDYPKSTFNMRMTRLQFIKYLKKLPTIVPDNKINRVLKRMDKTDF